ncbi:MAG: thiolase family protein [Alphaproteobacteria bacterium]
MAAKTTTASTLNPETSAVIVGYARSPFTPANKGALAGTRADDLAAQVVNGLIKKTGVEAKHIEDLILGCAFPEAEQGFNLARLVVMLAGLPLTIGGVTINRFCGSSMEAIHMAAGRVAAGMGEVFLCAGVEGMSRVPMTGFNPMPNPTLFAKMPEAYIGMGETAENLAVKYKISRKDQEKFAAASHKKAATAFGKNYFKDEIVPITTTKGVVEVDGCIRPETDAVSLAALKPAFDQNGTVTAGTASPLTDGASAVLVTSEAYARKHKLPIIARIKSFAVSGCKPEIMGIGPVESSKKALKRAGLTLSDMDVIELNEAFGAQSLAVLHDLDVDTSKVNIDGGAIALGHPLGASGARITGKAASLLKRTKGKYALATMCIGGGQGIATVLEAVD